jgi:hypothetical protein
MVLNTSFRFLGYKGMVGIDCTLEGKQMRLRCAATKSWVTQRASAECHPLQTIYEQVPRPHGGRRRNRDCSRLRSSHGVQYEQVVHNDPGRPRCHILSSSVWCLSLMGFIEASTATCSWISRTTRRPTPCFLIGISLDTGPWSPTRVSAPRTTSATWHSSS